jgi:hypothetical protein
MSDRPISHIVDDDSNADHLALAAKKPARADFPQAF